jgi:hypothetical protein
VNDPDPGFPASNDANDHGKWGVVFASARNNTASNERSAGLGLAGAKAIVLPMVPFFVTPFSFIWRINPTGTANGGAELQHDSLVLAGGSLVAGLKQTYPDSGPGAQTASLASDELTALRGTVKEQAAALASQEPTVAELIRLVLKTDDPVAPAAGSITGTLE